ncbi:hypothetical protein [Tropicimonas sp. IMCC34043]|uniref:hypothetical protein n=1 Tax=Tropicimonas sp. IMCC34043 TaxID=2248760 RepID=UPI0013005F6C|nr:hypothetical protein [Tropicimonas sp. IMCC34043]
MFNLIVSSSLEGEKRGTIPISRVFEHTDDKVANDFMPSGVLDILAVMAMPTVFMGEGKKDQIALVGRISKVEVRGSDYRFQYTIDPSIPRLTNADIVALADELNIDEWEFSRNHWAIKDADLFYTLYRRGFDSRPTQDVLNMSTKPTNPKLVSMMMPFSETFSRAYQEIKRSLTAEGYECHRADDFWNNNRIMDDVTELLCTSNIVICDLTGKNPNVFYEAGIAHALGKKVILITQSKDDVPFDLGQIRFIPYHDNNEGLCKLAGDVLQRVQTIA